MFQASQTVTEDGLIMLHGVVTGCAQNLDFKDINLFLKHALEQKEKNTARLTCGILSDLAYTMPNVLQEYLADFVPSLLELLSNGNLDRMIKVHALRALGDLAMNCSTKFTIYFLE